MSGGLCFGALAAHLGTWVGLTLAGGFGDEHGNRVKLVIIALHLTRHEEIRVCGGGRGSRGMMEGGEMVNQAKGKKKKKKRKGKNESRLNCRCSQAMPSGGSSTAEFSFCTSLDSLSSTS